MMTNLFIQRKRRLNGLLRNGILAYVIFTSSICYVLILKGLESSPPVLFSGVRTLLGGMALLGFSLVTGRNVIPDKSLWKWVPAVGLTTALTFGSMFLSPSFSGAGLASILGNSQPLFIALIAFMFLREKLSGIQSFGLALGLVGVLLIITPSFTGRENLLLTGASLALLTSLAAACGTVIGRHLKLSESLLPFTAWQLIIGGVTLIMLSVVLAEPSIQWSVDFIAVLVVLSVFNTALVTCAWFWLLKNEKAGTLGSYLFTVPVLGVIWAYLFQGEQPTASSLFGGGLVLLGVFSSELKNLYGRLRSKTISLK